MNEYLDLLKAAPAAGTGTPDNPYLGMLEKVEDERKARLSATLVTTAGANPDEFAKQRQTAAYLGLPTAAVEAQPDIAQQQARIKQVAQDTANSPTLQRKYSEADFAKLAHDDSGVLSSIAAAAKYIFSHPDQRNTLVGDTVGGLYYQSSASLAGAFRSVAEFPAPLLDPLVGRVLPANPLRVVAEGFAKIGRESTAKLNEVSPPAEGVVAGGVTSGFRSLGQNSKYLLLALFGPAGAAAALTGMSAEAGGQSYQDAREKGLTAAQALPFATSQAIIEYGTEKLPLGKLLEGVNAGAPIWKTIAKTAAAEVPGEQLATVLQDMNEWAVLPENKDKPFSEYLAERPSAAAQTLIATLIGAGGNVVIADTARTAIDRMLDIQRGAQEGEATGQNLQQLFALAAQSRLRERAPDTFQGLVQELADEPGGVPAEVRFDARTLAGEDGTGGVLNQEQLAAIPSIQAQIGEALATGGEVVVPIGELMQLADSGVEKALIEHARVGTNELSRAEAKLAAEQAEQFLQQEAQRVIETARNVQNLQARAETVLQTVLDQLNTTSRFTADVNRAYATLVRDFYVTMADRLGITPDELYTRYPLRVAGSTTPGLSIMDQAAYHGSPYRGIDRFSTQHIGKGEGAQAYGWGLYFAGSKKIAEFYRKSLTSGSPQPFTRDGKTITDTADLAEAYYKPGNVVRGFGGADKVLKFERGNNGKWEVQVVGVRANGETMPGERPRWHSTFPEVNTLRDALQSDGWTPGEPGQLYTAEVPDDSDLLDYDAKLADQPEKVRKALEGLGFNVEMFKVSFEDGATGGVRDTREEARKVLAQRNVPGKITRVPHPYDGKQVYSSLSMRLGSDEAASKALAAAGIPGLRYLDAGSRGAQAKSKSHNYVIFHDDAVQKTGELYQGARGFDAWVGDADVVDIGDAHEFKDGEPVVVAALHGTTGDFTSFDKSMANIESDLGGGFYFTNNPADVGENYAGMGPDLTQKIQIEAERLESSDDIDPEEAKRIARDKWMANEGLTMPVWVKFENPVVLGGGSETFLTYEENYNEELDQYDEPTGTLLDVIEALREVASDERYGDGDVDQVVADIMEKAAENGGLSAREFIETAKLSEGLVYVSDYESEGKLASTEVLRRAFEGAGFDGFIDATVNDKFGSNRDKGKAMAGMDEDTVHFIAFKPTQIKSRLGNNGNFDPSKANILEQSPIDTPEFKRWFGDSKVVDAQGKPLVVYHGTGKDFGDVFNTQGGTGKTADTGAFFSSSTATANSYASGEARNVMPVYITLKTPLVVDAGGANWNRIGQKARVEMPEITAAPATAQEDENLLAELEGREPETVKPIKRKAKKTNVRELFKGEWAYPDDTASTDDIARWARKQGYDGVIFRNVKDRGPSGAFDHEAAQAPADLFVAFRPEQIKSALGNRGTFDPTNPSILEQGPRGTFNPGTLTTSLLESADLSTFLHETGHFFLTVMADIAAQPNAPAGIAEDMGVLLKWFGVKDLETWSNMSLEQQRKHHERFAESFEQYLLEGKAPSTELQQLFHRFRAWLTNVYRSLREFMVGRNLDLNDEVRAVFDRLLASESQIKQAEMLRGYEPLFKSAAEAGMTPQEWAAYQAQGREATDQAIDQQQSRSLRDMRWATNARSKMLKALQKDAAGKRKAVEAEVASEVAKEPIYQAMRWLRKGEMTSEDGEEIKAEKGFRLSTDALAEMYPDSALDNPDLDRLKGMTAANGLHPDVVAGMFGFSSGDQLVRALADAEPMSSVIEGLTDSRMLERFGDMATEQGIQRAADEAIHNEARGRFVATELATLQAALGGRQETGRTDKKGRPITSNVMVKAAKQFAENIVNRRKVRDLKVGPHTAAETRAAKNAEKALRKGDTQLAVTAKRDQLLNHYAARATGDALDEVDRSLTYLKKFEREATRKKLDAEYLDQVDKLLERVELRERTLRALDKRARLADWIKSQEDLGIEPTIPDYVREDAQLTNYKELTLEEFRGLVDTVKQIEHLGRLKNKLLTAKDQREFEAIRDSIAQSITDNAGGRSANTRTPTTLVGKSLAAVKAFGAAHIKAATLARVMDGNKDGGPMWEYFVRSANERGDQETAMRAEATKALATIVEPWLKAGKANQKKFFATINRSLTRQEALVIALNTGNEGNLQRLLGGEGWTADQLKPVLESLSAQDWSVVQNIWNHFESYRPLIAEKEKRVFGKEPEWVEPSPFEVTTADGKQVQVKGGYYPIKYDPAASVRAEEHADAEGAKRLLKGAYGAATTRRSFTKSRAEEVTGRPLLYDLSGVYSGVNDVIHDLAWHEWLIDVNRLLKSTSIDSAMRNAYGPDAVRQFKSWRDAVAEGDQASTDAIDIAIGRLRQSVSVAGLGFNVMSALMQPLGFTQSVVRIGAAHVGRGVLEYVGRPIEATREVNEKSTFMRNRSRTRFRELNEIRNRVQGQSTFQRVMAQHAYTLMLRVQQMVDVPTWLGAYEKALAAGNDEKRAIALADQAVIDSQGGGQTKDLAAIERGGQAAKLFTVFYSFMNTTANLAVASKMGPDSKAKFAANLLLLTVVPAVLGSILKDVLTPGDSGDDDREKLAKKLAGEQLSYLLGLVVVGREFGEATKTAFGLADRPRDYAGPAGLRAIADAYKFAKQAGQGEFDDSFRKAAVNLAGDLMGLPAAQINRTITGTKALVEGETQNPAAVLMGYQKP